MQIVAPPFDVAMMLHGLHAVRPGLSWKVSRGQDAQKLELNAPGTRRVWAFPGGHNVHKSLELSPGAVLYVPEGQSSHVPADVCLVAALYLPGTHILHDVLAASA